MNFELIRFCFFADDQPGGGGAAETPEEKAARLEAELALKEKQIRDQNSYITKLEQQKQTTQQPVNNPQPAAKPQTGQSAAERFAYKKATEEEIEKVQQRAKELLGEETAEIIKEDVIAIARANIKDPFEVTPDLHDRVIKMAAGNALVANQEKRIKIAGAYIKAPQVETPQPVIEKVVVPSPAGEKIGTMQPGDRQGLGTNPLVQQQEPTKPQSPRAFLAGFRGKHNK